MLSKPTIFQRGYKYKMKKNLNKVDVKKIRRLIITIVAVVFFIYYGESILTTFFEMGQETGAALVKFIQWIL